MYINETIQNTVQTIQNTVNTSTPVTKTTTHYKTRTYTNPHITKQVKTTTVQDTHQMKYSHYSQVPSVYRLPCTLPLCWPPGVPTV